MNGKTPPASAPDMRPAPPLAPDFLSLFGDAAVVRWAIQLRWWMLGAMLGLGLLLTLTGALAAPMYGTVLLLVIPVAAYNLAFVILLHLAPLWRTPARLSWVRWLQAPPDLIMITVAIHLTGGATTPFAIFYVLFILTAVVLTPRYGTYVAAVEAALCYGLLVLLELTVWPPPANPLLAPDRIAAESRLFVYGWHLLTLLFILVAAAYMADRVGRRILTGEEIIQRQVGDLTLLYRFGDNLSALPNLEQALQYIVTELSAILGAGDCSLILLNERNEAEIRAAVGIPTEALIAYRKRPLDPTNPLLAAVLSSSTGVFAPDIEQIPGLRDLVVRPAQSFYCFPLRTEERTLGMINFSFTRPYTMPPSTYDLMAACSRQASMAIERALLYQEAQRAAREMSSLYHIGLAASSSLEINSVLSQIADQIQGLMTPDSLVLAFYDDTRDLLDFVLQRADGRLGPRATVPVGQAGAAGWIVAHRQPLLIRDRDGDMPDMPVRPVLVDDALQSLVGVPLMTNNRVIGVISVQKREPAAYGDDALRLLSAIAAQAALALENARLHEATREQALRDSLTGAYNHATLIDNITREVEHAAAAGTTAALIMLDIDLFKQYNDTYGHAAGDDALRTVVEAIAQNVKSTDSVGRWGGEEFGVLLPGASCANALQVAYRIRATLARIEMPVHNGTRLPVPTVSQGIACYPADSPTSAELVDHADMALYRAKARGRDCIVHWDQLSAPVLGKQ